MLPQEELKGGVRAGRWAPMTARLVSVAANTAKTSAAVRNISMNLRR